MQTDINTALNDIADRISQLPIAAYTITKTEADEILTVFYPVDYTPPGDAIASLQLSDQVILVESAEGDTLFRAVKKERSKPQGFKRHSRAKLEGSRVN
jgi:hypothetical protein